jgi:thiaminase (transcriptional activator TenA)
MSPCMRLYAYLGQALARDPIPADHPYRDWIATYSAADFAGLVEHLAALTDRYAAATPLTRATYRHAMACELAFFAAAWQEGSAP